MSKFNQFQTLIDKSSEIINNQKQLKKTKGENFNIFSILKVETKENATHSAFIGELLNPKGSHLCDALFLNLFLKNINYQGKLDVKTAFLKLEEHIGQVNHKDNTGGRIDIYIKDHLGNTICIENKIFAGFQYNQLERYINHNKSKNTVYLLTLNNHVVENQDSQNPVEYNCISYQQTIISWLENCLKEITDLPIIRETIRQYILLLKKLTNTLDSDNMEQEILDLISDNYETVKVIAANIYKAEHDVALNLLKAIKSELENKLSDKDGWSISVDDKLDISWTGLYISHTTWDGILVKLEGQSKLPWNMSCYGICANKTIWDRNDLKTKLSDVAILKNGFKESHAWSHWKEILYLRNTDERKKIFDKIQCKELVIELSNKLFELAISCQIPLSNINKIVKA